MARFTTLYSGSSGNAAVVEEEGRFIIIDMGNSCRAALKALAEAGLSPEGLVAVLVTHEHSDHIRGLEVFLRRFPVPVFGSAETLDKLWYARQVPPAAELVAVCGRSEEVAGFTVTAFPTSHDAAGCCGFRVETPSGAVMAIATDLGMVTEEVYGHFEGAGLVALEANYDREMLRTGPYPRYLKQRIASPRGHLSNDDSAAVVARLVLCGCQQVSLCHLSEENNTPGQVRRAVEQAMFTLGVRQPEDCTIQVARRYEVSDWMAF